METAFTLLFVGMITVFAVLGLVAITGNLLIRFVNWITPEKVETAIPGSGRLPADDSQAGISPEMIAAITAVVERLTEGKGRVSEIKKSDPD